MEREPGPNIHDPSAEDRLLDLERRGLVVRMLASLPPQEAALLRAVYFDGISLAAAAKALGYDKSWASRIHRRAINRLSSRVKRELW